MIEAKFKDYIQLGVSRDKSKSRHKLTSVHKNPSADKPIINKESQVKIKAIKSGIKIQQEPIKVAVLRGLNENAQQIVVHSVYQKPELRLNMMIPITTRPQFYQSPPTKRITVNSKEKRKQIQKENLSPEGKMFQTQLIERNIPVSPRILPRVELVNLNPHQAFLEKEEDLCRKLKTLEARISHLVSEKINIETTLNEENRRLYHENQFLKSKISADNVEELKRRLSKLEQMLQNQINKSLELMDQNQTLKKQLKKIHLQVVDKVALTETLNHSLQQIQTSNKQIEIQWQNERQLHQKEMQSIKIQYSEQLQELNLEMQNLACEKGQILAQFQGKQIQINSIVQQYEAKIIQIIQEKDSQIEGLNDKILEIEKKTEDIQSGFEKSSIMKESGMSWRTEEVIFSQEKKQCKKCQQLLKTVFKLNSHLSKK